MSTALFARRQHQFQHYIKHEEGLEFRVSSRSRNKTTQQGSCPAAAAGLQLWRHALLTLCLDSCTTSTVHMWYKCEARHRSKVSRRNLGSSVIPVVRAALSSIRHAFPTVGIGSAHFHARYRWVSDQGYTSRGNDSSL